MRRWMKVVLHVIIKFLHLAELKWDQRPGLQIKISNKDKSS